MLIISTVFSPFNCIKDAENDVYILWNNPSQNCFEKEWNSYLPFIISMSFIYAIIVPGFFAFIFFKNRKDPSRPKFRARYGALVQPYRPKYFYWELILMLKRASFFLVNQLGFFSDNYTARFSASICMLAIFGSIDVMLEPYNTKRSNMLNNTWNLILLLVLLCQGLIFEPSYSSQAYLIFGIYIIVIVSGTIAAVLFGYIKSLRHKEESTVLTFSKHIFDQMPEHIKLEILQIYSRCMIEQFGGIALKSSKEISHPDLAKQVANIEQELYKNIQTIPMKGKDSTLL